MGSKLRFQFPRLENSLLVGIFNREPVPRVPVWMMRQAGRTDPEYCRLRKEDGRPLEEVFLDAEFSTKISLLPRRLGVDAIIMFQDILTPLAPMGAGFKFNPAPVLHEPIIKMEQVRRLKTPKPPKDLKTVGRILQGLNAELQGSLPVLGFAGAPMTLAFFMISGKSPSAKIPEILDFMETHPSFTEALLERLTETTIDYLLYQIENGAHIVQLFDSFADKIPEPFYLRWVQPSHERILKSLERRAPGILFSRGCPYIDLLAATGADALSLGDGISISKVREKYPDFIIQGNIDNKILADGSPEMISDAIRTCLNETKGSNHILNLSHGLLERTPFENVLHFVQSAQKLGRKD